MVVTYDKRQLLVHNEHFVCSSKERGQNHLSLEGLMGLSTVGFLLLMISTTEAWRQKVVGSCVTESMPAMTMSMGLSVHNCDSKMYVTLKAYLKDGMHYNSSWVLMSYSQKRLTEEN